ncbi:unnamed protein product [Thlaspi arvense]|uniref:Uncharacterized protein n=1 Tax=Thlaspi arvense TaxID=13288 RepID=A0AAU9RY40_THLAR|nr:unnamed protein product [Thlaspi arvense]
MDSVGSDGGEGTWSSYNLHSVGNCHRAEAVKRLQHIQVLSRKLERNVEQMNPPRRQCCDISSPYNKSMVINIRQCMTEELIVFSSWLIVFKNQPNKARASLTTSAVNQWWNPSVVLKDLLPAIFPLFLGRCELIQFLLQPTGDQSINGTPQSTHQHICLEHLILASRHCYLVFG